MWVRGQERANGEKEEEGRKGACCFLTFSFFKATHAIDSCKIEDTLTRFFRDLLWKSQQSREQVSLSGCSLYTYLKSWFEQYVGWIDVVSEETDLNHLASGSLPY
jgi:hypothetical protein